MKRIFISLALMCAMVVYANAQDYTKSSDGKTYSAVKKTNESSERETGFTWKDSNAKSATLTPESLDGSFHLYIKVFIIF